MEPQARRNDVPVRDELEAHARAARSHAHPATSYASAVLRAEERGPARPPRNSPSRGWAGAFATPRRTALARAPAAPRRSSPATAPQSRGSSRGGFERLLVIHLRELRHQICRRTRPGAARTPRCPRHQWSRRCTSSPPSACRARRGNRRRAAVGHGLKGKPRT